MTKLFVLDTNVLLHDPTSVFRFGENDVYIPLVVLEELDNHKKGTSDIARNARQVSRTLDTLINGHLDLSPGLKLESGGKLFIQTDMLGTTAEKNDDKILEIAQNLKNRNVVLVSKDINIRIKAKALGIWAEDYENDHLVQDRDVFRTGVHKFSKTFWAENIAIEEWHKDKNTYYKIKGPGHVDLACNEIVEIGDEAYAVDEVGVGCMVLRTMRNYMKHEVWGIKAKNPEQSYAMNMLLDPNIDFVTLTGPAGTGKSILVLATGLHQTFDTKVFQEIIATRATVPMGEEIGFLPGDEQEKMTPWMGAIEGNLEVLLRTDDDKDIKQTANMLIKQRVKIKSMSFMRGATYNNRLLIIDEAQNLTPKQMKTLVTRAGEGTKVLCLGNVTQIDTPYLTEHSSGLTYAVEKFRGWKHAAHIMLTKGERSRLAEFANENL